MYIDNTNESTNLFIYLYFSVQMSQHTEKPEYRFNINYGINNAITVKTGDISKEGYKLDTNSMPKTADWPTLDDRQRTLIDQVLGHMEGGIYFTIEDKNLYAERLCRTQIFRTDKKYESIKLDRKVKTKIFDVDNRDETSVCLTLAREINKGDSLPFKKVLVYVEIYNIEKHNQLVNYDPTKISSSLDPLISDSMWLSYCMSCSFEFWITI